MSSLKHQVTKSFNRLNVFHFRQKTNFAVTMPISRLLIVFLLHIMDITTDILLNIDFAMNDDWYWFSFSLSFLILPNIIFACTHFMLDTMQSKFARYKNFILDLFGLQIFARLWFMRERRHTWTGLETQHKLFVKLIRVFEAFFESIPQMTLQTYILLLYNGIEMTEYRFLLLIASIALGLTSVAVASTSIDEEIDLPWEYFVNVLFYLSQVSLRVLAFAFFAKNYHGWPLFAFIGADIITTSLYFSLTSLCSSVRPSSQDGQNTWFKFLLMTTVSSVIAYHVFFKNGSEAGLIFLCLFKLSSTVILVVFSLIENFQLWVLLFTIFCAIIFIVCGAIFSIYTYAVSPADLESVVAEEPVPIEDSEIDFGEMLNVPGSSSSIDNLGTSSRTLVAPTKVRPSVT